MKQGKGKGQTVGRTGQQLRHKGTKGGSGGVTDDSQSEDEECTRGGLQPRSSRPLEAGQVRFQEGREGRAWEGAVVRLRRLRSAPARVSLRDAGSARPRPGPREEEPSLAVEAVTCHHKHSLKKRVNSTLQRPGSCHQKKRRKAASFQKWRRRRTTWSS
ncbi:hypothetical protein CB1_056579048 [Camelus ferus]|nr:hypothetical protein CB1_056579048 [Camelus ferus]